ncbi:MAG: AMP-binding protein [Bacteroidales bacterium]|nr:AMP-binding protein [Bacteroidales bacterium]
MIIPNKLTLRDLIVRSQKDFPLRPALSFVGETPLTYSDLANIVRNISGMLLALGIEKGDRVAILGENSPNWGASYFAITSIGAIAVPILTDFSEIEIENILEHSEAKAIFVSSKFYSKINADRLKKTSSVILLNTVEVIDESPSNDNLLGYIRPSSILNPTLNSIEFPIPEEDELAVILYTSGTTGRSKGVMLSHKNLVSNLISTLGIQSINPKDRFLSVLPLSHTYECTIGFLLPLYCGATVYYLSKPPTAAVLIPAMQTVKPTMILTVPLIIEKIYRSKIYPELTSSPLKKYFFGLTPTRKLMHRIAAKKLHKTFGGKLHFFGVGGAKLSHEVEQFLSEGRFPYSIGYGMTEASPLISGCTPKITGFRQAGYCLPGQELRIDNPNAENGEGEIHVRGANVMVGYYKEPLLTTEMFTDDGWLKTGDLGVLNSKGYIELKGRLKNMILGPSGENIYPEEIEDVINNHDLVSESLVYELKGKLVARVHLNYEALESRYSHLRDAAITLQQEIDLVIDEMLEEIRIYVNSRVSNFSKVNLVVVQVEPFEKTPTQKIKRYLYTKN